jgi:PAS domain S-box-containing protein
MATDITERKRLEDAFSSAALAVSQSEEETLYRQLARYLSAILDVDGAFIATTAPGDSCTMRMLAFHLDGEVRENFTYPLAGTPCETVVGSGFRLYPSRLGELFPLDADFQKLGLDCYAGQPLTDGRGRPLGLISVVSRRPFRDAALVEATLRIFAVRVNAELERAAAAAALRASEANYRQIFEASEDAIFVHDWDTGAILDANARACESYGYVREDLLRLRAGDLSAGEPPYTEEEAFRWIEQARRDGSANFEWRRRNSDGSLHWDEVRLKRAVIGGQQRILAFTHDITERKNAEEALRASEEQYRTIFNASADAMVLWDSKFRRVDVNPAFETLYGWTRDEVIGRGFDFPSFSLEHGRLREELVRRALAGESCHAEHDVIARDGRRLQVEVHAIPCRRDGEPHVLVIGRDITERKNAEEALRASEEQYRAIFNASTDALILWDSKFRRVDVNEAYERTYGWSRDEVLGLGYGCSPDYAAPRESMVRQALAGEACRAELESVRKDGEHIIVEVQALPFRHRNEPHVLAIARDVTDRKRADAERQELEARLRQAQKMEAIGQLTGGIAHDFNNLLTSIMGYVTLARDRDSALADPRLGNYLAQAQRSCERARDLIQQMLMFSRGRRGSPRAVSLASVVRGALPTLRAGLPDTLELSVATYESAAPVFVDPAQVEQVLLNLCINARDATDGVGRVRIGVRPGTARQLPCSSCRQCADGPVVELVVEDGGHGMSPEVIERIFEPFFSTKETGKGSGMGLAMVHGIVHEHGGHIVVESSPGAGARFRIIWPAVTDSLEVPQGETQGESRLRPPRPSLQGSVLVVDDEETVREFMRELLESWGLASTCTSTAAAALDLVRSAPRRFDVVITDHSMPKMTGLELARQLRQIRADLPVILYTGNGEGLAGEEVDAARLCALMLKPIDPTLLSQTLARCLSSRAPATT